MIDYIMGGIASDHRGNIRFVNDFDMSEVKRFYILKNLDTDLVRGWRGHKIEQRWFYVLSGSFSVDLVKIDDWQNPTKDLPVKNDILSVSQGRLMHVPVGYATAFKALEPGSEMLVFADHGIENAIYDDHTFPYDYFVNRHS